MPAPPTLLAQIGGEEGCRRLATDFYRRVQHHPSLRPLFPGKSLRCATDEFAAFLIQFLGGDEAQSQSRWWLSLRESHARFSITPAQRAAWWDLMSATLLAAGLDPRDTQALGEMFRHASKYVTGGPGPGPGADELSFRWAAQLALDDAVAAIAASNDSEALRLLPRFAARPGVLTGLLARMTRTARPALVDAVCQALQANPALVAARFSGRTLLHLVAASGSVPVAGCLLALAALLLQHGALARHPSNRLL